MTAMNEPMNENRIASIKEIHKYMKRGESIDPTGQKNHSEAPYYELFH